MSTNVSVQGSDSGPESRNRYYKYYVVVKIMRITVLMLSMRRGDPPRKSSSPIRASECFRPLHKLIGVESVRKIETGLERGQWLSRKLRNTVLMLSSCPAWPVCCNYQFSQQPLTAFESRFDFPDRLDPHKRMQRPKTFRRANRRRRFPRRVSRGHPAA